MKTGTLFTALFLGLALMALQALAGPDTAGQQTKIDAQIELIKLWAADPVIVNAVKAQNASLSPAYSGMTQEKWGDLSKLDPFVRTFDRSSAGQFLKSKKSAVVIRAFVSDASGIKVAFTTKTLTWSHKGDPKHAVPMSGKVWQGPFETDKATGFQQVQVSVPVMDSGKPIGSLVVGLNVANL